ncbi:MAG: hypothetical protein JOZ51_01690 [Chloroflexi bacterium]|nr:hypothetical protein [Chloroflexota bacterium]
MLIKIKQHSDRGLRLLAHKVRGPQVKKNVEVQNLYVNRSGDRRRL